MLKETSIAAHLEIENSASTKQRFVLGCRRSNIVRLFLFLAFLFSQTTSAQTLPGLIESRQVGSRARYHRLDRTEAPWAIHVVEFDYSDSLLRVETARANDADKGLEKTSTMALKQNRERHQVVAAINGDFFKKNGAPVNLQIHNGEIVNRAFPRSVLAMSETGKPQIIIPELKGKAIASDGLDCVMSGINRARNTDELIFFNQHFGKSTGTNAYGREIQIRLLERFMVNDTIDAVVIDEFVNIGNASIDSLTCVLSAHGNSASWLAKSIAIGDTIQLLWNISQLPFRISEAIGGTPRIVRDGRISIEHEQENIQQSFVDTRHPRTAVGFNGKDSKMYFVVVDGRQPDYSVGMTLYELAVLMLELGCEQALNLDGGGSSTMVVRGRVVNKPSDLFGEREVANSLHLVSSAPTGTLAFIHLRPRRVEALAGEAMNFEFTAMDRYFNPLTDFTGRLSWEVDSKIGAITQEGVLITATVADSGFVFLASDGVSDSAKVIVREPIAVRVIPSQASLGVGGLQRFTAQITHQGGQSVVRPVGAFAWQIEGNAGRFIQPGVFRATQNGKVTISAKYKNGKTELTGLAIIEVK